MKKVDDSLQVAVSARWRRWWWEKEEVVVVGGGTLMALESDSVVCSLRVTPSRMTSVHTPMMLSACKMLRVVGFEVDGARGPGPRVRQPEKGKS